MTPIFEGQPPQNKAETPIKTVVIWGPGICIPGSLNGADLFILYIYLYTWSW